MTLFRWRGRLDDPGSAWVESALRPIRAQRIDTEVRRSVMARIAAEKVRPLRHPAILRRPRLALAACMMGGIVAFGLVVASLLILAINGDEGVRQIGTILSAAGHLLVVMGGFVLETLRGVLSAGLALGRGIWILLEAAAPLLRGAGMMAAAGGLLSILISFYLLAQGYRSAPLTALEGGAGGLGGNR